MPRSPDQRTSQEKRQDNLILFFGIWAVALYSAYLIDPLLPVPLVFFLIFALQLHLSLASTPNVDITLIDTNDPVRFHIYLDDIFFGTATLLPDGWKATTLHQPNPNPPFPTSTIRTAKSPSLEQAIAALL